MRTIASFFLILFLSISPSFAQISYKTVVKKSVDGKYSWTEVTNDPTGVRTYVLKNGLTVMLAENHAEPKIASLLAVRAGSKHDPADNTGLAHYLEHMLFKGTDRFGTRDFAAESRELAKIDSLYKVYNRTSDAAARKSVYHKIDSVSGVAASFAIANEYDKLMNAVGSNATNAFTSFENTTYMENFAANNLEKFLEVQQERFRNPVLRLFHTELEAVYEEKNISMDDGSNKVFETMFAALFKKHQYGTQTTIGTVEHLKNPSLDAIRNYYKTNYVPGNMALILAGDFKADEAIVLIDKYLGVWEAKPVPKFKAATESPRKKPEEFTVYSPDESSVAIGYRIPGALDKQAVVAEIVSRVLYNGKSGFIDKNLVKNQKLMSAYGYNYLLQDYGVFYFGGRPMEGQKLSEVRDLILNEIEKLKKGDFDEEILAATVNNMRVERIRYREDAFNQAFTMHDQYVTGKSWEQYLTDFNAYSKVTKKDVVTFANKWFAGNHAVVYKETGVDSTITKVEKPEITPVDVNRDARSPFVQSIIDKQSGKLEPQFIDYDKAIAKSELMPGVDVWSVKNTTNELFELYYVLEMGRFNDPLLPLAIDYLNVIGTSTMNNEQVNAALYKAALNLNISTGNERVFVSLSGLQEQFGAALNLLENLLSDPKADAGALEKLVAKKIKERNDRALNRYAIFGSGLESWAMYGAKNPFNDVLSDEQMKAVTPEQLISIIKKVTSYPHRVYYYGPEAHASIHKVLAAGHKLPSRLLEIPPRKKYEPFQPGKNTILFVNYDMVQAEMTIKRRDAGFNEQLLPMINAFNTYYGGSMGSIVFQEIRESKALAYSAYAYYGTPSNKEEKFTTNFYIGTQADKLESAMSAAFELLTTMPKSEKLWEIGRSYAKQEIEASRITKSGIMFDYAWNLRYGIKEDTRKRNYETIDAITIEDIDKFHREHINGSNWVIKVIGSKEKIDFAKLAQFGEVTEISLSDLFGFPVFPKAGN
jgi:predicted Zn-dependent peptidase